MPIRLRWRLTAAVRIAIDRSNAGGLASDRFPLASENSGRFGEDCPECTGRGQGGGHSFSFLPMAPAAGRFLPPASQFFPAAVNARKRTRRPEKPPCVANRSIPEGPAGAEHWQPIAGSRPTSGRCPLAAMPPCGCHSEALTFSTTAPKASGSCIANSESDLRSSSICAFLSPFMNWL